MEARKAVAEKLKFEPEVAGCIQLEDGLRIFSRPAVEAFNLCVSLQERVDVLEKALRACRREADWVLSNTQRGVKSTRMFKVAGLIVELCDATLSPKGSAIDSNAQPAKGRR